IVAVAAAMALYMVLGGRFKLSAINGRGGVNAKGTLGVKERSGPQKDAVLSYRSLVDAISHALRMEADASWEIFSAAYLRRGSAEHALDAAFGAHPCFASFDWRDLDSCQEFVSQAGAALSPEEVFDASRCDSRSAAKRCVASSHRRFDMTPGWPP